jgi:glucose/arabinose dehydrogenase
METLELTNIARGVRNSVGFDWHPDTGQLWFTDNGRDHMGDDLPPCEINVITEEGQHFGYPYLHGTSVPDPEFSASKPADLEISLPAEDLGAHVAPLGLSFYSGQMFPDQYRNTILVAEHGSWNRSDKIGYRIMIGQIVGAEVVDYRPFIEGWLMPGELNWGRPVAFQPLPDGSVLISDDYAGVVYRLTYQED